MMAKAYPSATRSAWLHGAKPTLLAPELRSITLDQLLANVAMGPPSISPSAGPLAGGALISPSAGPSFTHVVLIAPHAHPAKSYPSMLHESVPEIVSIFPENDTSVLAVIPVKDALSVPSRDLVVGVVGVVEDQVKIPKPAYKAPPKSPLVLYQLRPRAPNSKPKVIEREGGRPTTCVEVFAGSAVLTQELVRVGFTGRAYECAPDGPRGAYLPERGHQPPRKSV